MNQSSNTILLHVATNTFFNTLFEYSKELRKNHFTPVLYFDNYYPLIEEDLNKLRGENLQFEIYPCRSQDHISRSFFKKISAVLINNARRVDYYLFDGFFFDLERQSKKYRSFQTLLTAYRVRGLIMISDLVQYDTGLLIKAAFAASIKVFLLPLFSANYKEAAEHHYYDKSLHVSRFFFSFLRSSGRLKNWVIKFRGILLIRLPLSKILVKEILGISPACPWTINTGNAHVMMVEGEAVKRLFLAGYSYPGMKIEVIGSVNTDQLFYTLENKANLKEQMIKRFNLSPQKKNVLVALPADMHSSRYRESEFPTYKDFIDFWLDSTKLLDKYNIVLTVHPSMSKEERDYLTDNGFNLIDKPTIMYIGLFDLYLASISATIQWAITCGIPVINYDNYNYNYDDYMGVDGVKYVKTQKDFTSSLIEFNNYIVLEEYKKKTREHSIRMGDDGWEKYRKIY